MNYAGFIFNGFVDLALYFNDCFLGSIAVKLEDSQCYLALAEEYPRKGIQRNPISNRFIELDSDGPLLFISNIINKKAPFHKDLQKCLLSL